ncbi:MAG TPA: TIGR03118 family protein [Stellaceae bacterium]|nr:TIGR03118 family protein [Stellaceae bacterium]
MNRNLSHSRAYGATLANLAVGLLAAGAFVGAAASAHASTYQITGLVTDDAANNDPNGLLASLGLPPAAHVDPNLVNPWGASFTPTSPYWVSDNNSGFSTLYTAAGVQVSPPSPVTIADAASPANPTGQVFNGNPSLFVVTNGLPPTDPNFKSGSANFIFDTENGTISGRIAGTVAPSQSFIAVNNSPSGAVYKGLAIATTASGTFLYAANFNSGKIDVFDSSFKPAAGFNFTDPQPPPPVPPGAVGWAPFNVYNDGNGHLFVSYAAQNAAKHDDVAGSGNGFVDEFDTNGNFIKRVATGGVLDSPWGLDIAPAGFGAFANDLLVGNFGNGGINVFDPNTDLFLGTLTDNNGNPIVIGDLWALVTGNNGTGSNPNAVYFTAGLMDEMHGLFGDLAVVPEPSSLALLATALASPIWFARRRRRSRGDPTQA